jgi:hypothetical protein
MKALIRLGSLSNYVDLLKPDEKISMTLPYAQNAFDHSLDWHKRDMVIFKLEHISKLDGEDIAVYNFYEPKLAIRNDERLLLLEKDNNEKQKEINKLYTELTNMRLKYEPTNDGNWK